ncbi:hypothetical protein DFJ74DRAFT_682569 [Hyaloraphidium curvatum]|nr:hypothetical protein DFJ74DRAFT_682569 [Hyaloraphidium curvatum]
MSISLPTLDFGSGRSQARSGDELLRAELPLRPWLCSKNFASLHRLLTKPLKSCGVLSPSPRLENRKLACARHKRGSDRGPRATQPAKTLRLGHISSFLRQPIVAGDIALIRHSRPALFPLIDTPSKVPARKRAFLTRKMPAGTRVSLLFAFAGAFLASLAAGAPAPQRDCDVAILGGGSGGANTGVFLVDRGYRVCVFEAEDTLGGHCDTEDIPKELSKNPPYPGAPDWVDYGVNIYTNTTFLNQFGFFDPAYGPWKVRSDLHVARFSSRGVRPIDFRSYASPAYIADFSAGIGPIGPLSGDFSALVGPLAALFAIVNQYPWLESAGLFPDPIPSELLVPFSQFIAANPAIEPLVNSFFSAVLLSGGVGSYDKLTTLYALLNLRRGILVLGLFQRTGLLPEGGCGNFYEGIARFLSRGGNKVYFKSDVRNIVRTADGVQLTVKVGNQATKVYSADKLVVAIPQTLANLAILDLDDRERAAFADVRFREYYALGFGIEGGALSTVTNFSLTNLNLLAGGTQPAPPTVTAFGRLVPYFLAPGFAYSDFPLDDNQVRSFVEAQIANIPQTAIAKVTLERFYRHKGFQPHFPPEALARSPNPYTVIAGLQGNKGTFHVGALLSYAESTKIWENAFRMVEANFPIVN